MTLSQISKLKLLTMTPFLKKKKKIQLYVYHAAHPASAEITAPFTKLASSDAKNSAI